MNIMRGQKKNGAVLIMTLMALCLVFMMVSVLMQSTGIGLTNSASFYDREAALEAAKSGVDYAVTRLRSNFGWRGDANCAYISKTYKPIITVGSISSGLITSETNGNVVGLINNRNGNRSAFRIKFSYEDNSQATYDRVVRSHFGAMDSSDLLPTLSIQLPFVSINNLAGTSTVLAYRANNDGKGVNDNVPNLEYGADEDGKMRAFAYHVPAKRLCLIVEGLAGKGLRDCSTPVEVNDIANSNSWGSPITRRYVETYLTTVAPVINGDAAYASDEIHFSIAKQLFVSTHTRNYTSDVAANDDKSTVPRSGSLRSDKDKIVVSGGTLNTFNGRLICTDASFTADKSEYTFLDSDGVEQKYTFPDTTKEGADGSLIEPVAWEDVAQAENVKANTMLPGFYQWHTLPGETEGQVFYQLRYYKDGCKYDEKGRPVPVDKDSFQVAVPGDIDSTAAYVEVDGKQVQKVSMGPTGKIAFVTDGSGNITEPTVNLAGNLYCGGDLVLGSDVSEVTSLCPKVIVGDYLGETNSGSFGDDEDNSESGVLTVNGDIYVASSLFGTGAMVTNVGDITFMGSSILECGNSGVALYGNNVTLKSLEAAMAKAPADGAGKGCPLDNSISFGGSDPTLNADGSKNVAPDASLFDSIYEQWEKSSCNINSRSVDLDIFTECFASLGANISCVSASFIYRESPTFLGLVCFKDPKRPGEALNNELFAVTCDGNSISMRKYRYLTAMSVARDTLTAAIMSGVMSYLSEDALNSVYPLVTSINVPKEYVISSDEVSEEILEYIKKYGSVCYGDQAFSGVVYAKNSFEVDLEDKYNFSVTGAIRAQNGKIEVKCKNSELSYDESYLSKLLPGFNKVTCKMWNCW